MPSSIEKFLYSEPPLAFGAIYRYGMLVFGIGLLTWNIVWLSNLRAGYPYECYSGTVVALMLLLNHLAFAFRWPRLVTAVLRVTALVWIIVGSYYACYLSHVWFPLPVD